MNAATNDHYAAIALYNDIELPFFHRNMYQTLFATFAQAQAQAHTIKMYDFLLLLLLLMEP